MIFVVSRLWIHGGLFSDIPVVHVSSPAMQVPHPAVPVGFGRRHRVPLCHPRPVN